MEFETGKVYNIWGKPHVYIRTIEWGEDRSGPRYDYVFARKEKHGTISKVRVETSGISSPEDLQHLGGGYIVCHYEPRPDDIWKQLDRHLAKAGQ